MFFAPITAIGIIGEYLELKEKYEKQKTKGIGSI